MTNKKKPKNNRQVSSAITQTLPKEFTPRTLSSWLATLIKELIVQ